MTAGDLETAPPIQGSGGAAGFARNLVPWLVAAGCLVYAFRVVPFEACLEALDRARVALFLPIAVGAVLLWFALESATYAYAFSRFNARVSWREARSIRALSYLFTVVHWHLAKAAVVLRLKTTHRVPLLAGTSTLLLYQGIGFLVLTLFAGAGAWLHPEMPGARSIALGAGAAAAGLVVALVALRIDRPRAASLDALRSLAILQGLRRVELADVVIIGIAKTAYQLVFVLVYYFGMRTFGVDPSFGHVVVATAILQVIGGLPIAPAGFGTQQAAMLLLFSDPAKGGSDGPSILAFGFALPITTMSMRALLACLYLGDLSASASALASESAEPAAADSAAGAGAAAAGGGGAPESAEKSRSATTRA